MQPIFLISIILLIDMTAERKVRHRSTQLQTPRRASLEHLNLRSGWPRSQNR
jgi:hypothetical protein